MSYRVPREFTYSGPHLRAEGRDPDVVTTRWDGDGGASYEVAYDFRSDSMTTRVR